jgi:hypothetical protein
LAPDNRKTVVLRLFRGGVFTLEQVSAPGEQIVESGTVGTWSGTKDGFELEMGNRRFSFASDDHRFRQVSDCPGFDADLPASLNLDESFVRVRT